MSSKTVIDWLSVTTKSSPVGMLDAVHKVLPLVSTSKRAGGTQGYAECHDLVVAGGNLGFIAFGGKSQRGRNLVSISGRGCAMVPDHDAFVEAFSPLREHKATRIDIAFDDWHSDRASIADVFEKHFEGHFKSPYGGRNPKLNSNGEAKKRSTPWGGVTVNVGCRQSDVFTRIYEKGCKELEEMENAHYALLRTGWDRINNHWPEGHPNRDFLHKWVRVEVEMKPKTRQLPLSAIVERDNFFAGVSSYHSAVLDGADPARREKISREIEREIEKKLDNLAKQYRHTLREAIHVFDGDRDYVLNRILGLAPSPNAYEDVAEKDGMKRVR